MRREKADGLIRKLEATKSRRRQAADEGGSKSKSTKKFKKRKRTFNDSAQAHLRSRRYVQSPLPC